MPYAIMRFAKKKQGSIAACERHNERKKESYVSNPDIRRDATKENYHIIKPDNFTYNKACTARIKSCGCKERANSIRMVETLIAASPEFINAMNENEQREYFERAANFMSEKVGRKNIISAIVHMDEKTPHMHLVFCPITADGRLSAKEILGNKAKFCQWQDEFYDCMAKRWPELQRGEAAAITGRKHIPVHIYKMGEHLDKQYSQIETALEGINAFNAGKKRDEVLSMIKDFAQLTETYTTEVNKLQPMIDSYRKTASEADSRVSKARADVYELRKELNEKENIITSARWDMRAMQKQLRKYETLLARVPDDVKKKLNLTNRTMER